MSAKRSNISQIRKYLNGELDARAMYELERRAQDDPMLMDMIKGMESGDANEHTQNLDAIDLLIKQRIAKGDDRRVIPLFRYWAAAACLLIALGIGGWWLTHPTQKPLVATNIRTVAVPDKIKVQQVPLADKSVPSANKQVAATRFVPPKVTITEPSAASGMTVAEPTAIASDIKIDTGEARIASEKKTVVNNDTRELKEVSIAGYGIQAKRSVTGSVSTVDHAMAPNDTMLNQALAGRVAGLSVTKNKTNIDGSRIITGKVVEKGDGSMLPGVSIRISGKAEGTQTNADGTFSIAVPKDATLNIAYVGFESQQIKPGNLDNLKIELVPRNNSLSEVVVTGYGSAKPNVVSYEAEHPLIGWADYNKYLKENATLTDGKSVTIKLTFSVSADGTVSDIKIVKGSTDELNQRAIKLIENGSKWAGATDGKTKQVKLSIKFQKVK